MLRRALDLLGHLTGSPRLCVWGARWSDRDSSVLAKRRNFLLVRTTTWLVGPSPPRPMVGRLLCCLCLQNPLCVWTKCLLAPVLLAAEKCRGFLPIIAETPDCRQAQCSPCDEEEDYHNDDGQDEDDHCWDPIVSRLNVTMMRRLRRFWVTLLLMMRRLFLLLLFIYQHY